MWYDITAVKSHLVSRLEAVSRIAQNYYHIPESYAQNCKKTRGPNVIAP